MDEQNTTDETGKSCETEHSGTCGCGMRHEEMVSKCVWAFNRTLALAKDPKALWEVIRAEDYSMLELYTKLILIVATVPAIGNLLQGIYLGWFPLGDSLRLYLLLLAGVWVASFALKYISPQFGGTGDQAAILKLIGFSFAIGCIGGAFCIIPFRRIAELATIAVWVYGLYVAWLGAGPVLGIPQEKRIPFSGLAFLSIIVISAALYKIGILLA